MARPALAALVITLRRRLLGAVAALGLGLRLGRARAAAPSPLHALPAPEALAQLHPHPDGGWLAIGTSGRLWLLGVGTPPRALAEGLDPATPLATGHGRIAARRADGRLWVGGSAGDGGESDVAVNRHAGLLVLPLAIIAIAGDAADARVLRLEPGAAGRWQVVARSQDTVLPDARPLQADLDGRGDGGHIVVLGGPDAQRYAHAVLGDGVEATRVLLLERHGLQPLRTLDLPAPQVLEDIAPRPWAGGLVSMLSDSQGARLVCIEVDAGNPAALKIAASGPPIGTRHRWMAASTDGQRLVAVHMPHLSGVLTAYRRSGDRLIGQALASGLSNHAIGTRELDVSAWHDGQFLVPDAASRRLRRFDVDAARELEPIELPERLRQIAPDRGPGDLGLLGNDGRAWRLAVHAAGPAK